MTTTPQRRYLPAIKSVSRRQPVKQPVPEPPPSSVIAWAWYVNGVRKPAESMSVAARLACAGEGFVWLGLKDPHDEDLIALSSQFDLHPLAIEDAVHGHTRSKLEMFGDDLFMVISTVAYVDHEELTETSEIVATGQVMVFLGDHFVITVRRGEHAQLSTLRRSLEADPERLARGPSEVLYAIADKIIDDYLQVVAEFEKDVDEVETSVFSRAGQHEVDRVYQLKRELIEFKRSVMPLGAPLLRLATRELPVVPPEAKAYFRELADHHTEAREAVATFDEVLASILQASLARASVTDNEDVRKISAWVAIVAVPTMVAGIYGMNFENMPETYLEVRVLHAPRRHRHDHAHPVHQLQTQSLALASGCDCDPASGSWLGGGIWSRKKSTNREFYVRIRRLIAKKSPLGDFFVKGRAAGAQTGPEQRTSAYERVGTHPYADVTAVGRLDPSAAPTGHGGGDDHQDGRDGDRDDPADPVDSSTAVAAEGGVDEPPDEHAADSAQDGQPDGDVVLVARGDELSEQTDDDACDQHTNDFHDAPLSRLSRLRACGSPTNLLFGLRRKAIYGPVRARRGVPLPDR